MAFEVRSRWDLARNVLRLYYTIPFVMASVTGVVFALTIKDDWLLAVLIPLDVFLLALFVNLSNDYFDHKSGADQKRFVPFDPAYEAELRQIFNDKYYWMGNTFDKGEITERQGKVILAVIAVAAAIVAIPIVYYGGWVVLLMGAVAFFLSYFYTAPPLNLGAKGFGEIDVFLSFALMSYFSFYVMVNELNWEMLIIAITVGLAVMLMRAVDQLSGYEAHKAAGEKDFSVRFGQEGSARLTVWLLGVMYVLCGILVIFHGLNYLVLFLTLPVAFRMAKMFQAKEDKFRWLRPVPEMLKIASGHEILVVAAIAIGFVVDQYIMV
jgi:1,4-dihydroxy-2-naphthoate octaprenyltransferase